MKRKSRLINEVLFSDKTDDEKREELRKLLISEEEIEVFISTANKDFSMNILKPIFDFFSGKGKNER